MKSIILSGALLFGGCASAQTFSAAELSSFCSSDRAIIVGYVAGVVDKSDIDYGPVRDLFDVTMPNDMKPKTITAANAVKNHCRPKDATIGRVVDMLCKSITDHPNKGAMSGAALLDAAMNLAWPCN
jgi:Rap1a immunity proteins